MSTDLEKTPVPLLSIVTVCRNDLDNLKRTVDSVAVQEFDDYEHIVIDGGSTDGTADYLTQAGVTRFISEPDDGIFHAMNKGLELSRGVFVHFLNAGDTFHDPGVIANVANELNESPDVQLLYGDVYYPTSSRPYSLQPRRLTGFTLFRGTVCHQAWFMKADVYRELGGFDLRLKYKGDYDLLRRAVHLSRIRYRHIHLCVVDYWGGGYSEKTHQASRPEFEDVRRRYISRSRAAIYSLATHLLNPIHNAGAFQRMMSHLTELRARRAWSGQSSRED